MNLTIEHSDGNDWGTLHIEPGKDDFFQVAGYGTAPEITISLYSHEARELIELLTPIAETAALT